MDNQYKFECEHCHKKFKNKGGYASHIPYCHKNPNYVKRTVPINGHNNKGRVSSTKGKIVIHKDNTNKFIYPNEILQYLKQGWKLGVNETTKNNISIANKNRKLPGRANTEESEKERRRKISSTMKLNPLAGGKRHGSGRGKKGWYKGIFCDSSWELAYVIYCIDHQIPIKRCEEKRTYKWDGSEHVYIPDFVINNSTIVEIKGYNTKQWHAKQQQNPDIVVLYCKEIKPYMNYVIQKYGKNYIDLYEKS